PDPELAVKRSRRQPRHAPLQQERRDAAVALRTVDRGEDEEVVRDVGEADPLLLAVQDVGIAIAPGSRVEIAGIRPDARLRQPERRELLTPGLGDQPALL